MTAKTVSGISYEVADFISNEGNAFSFDEKIEFTFASTGTDFNKFNLVYSSERTVQGTIYYECAGKTVEDVFYLEAGNNVTFKSFIMDYLKGETASSVSKIVISRKQAGDEKFELIDLQFEKCPMPEADEIYIQNARYKLGIRLGWGGGISYIEDFNDGDDSIGNLLNNHDTGRLVQQSYYGTGRAPYVCAKFMDTTWNYNPVQGGDQYNNRSRLVDYKIAEDGQSVYVKCRPSDWAQNGQWTYSYMENTYSITEKGIKVDNRFCDFSGFDNPKVHQEVPAFYTISYLSDFVFYGGDKPWTRDAYTRLPDEPFWAGKSSAYHPLKNDETWCAWVSADTNWGIGVYTPITTELVAGRNAYNGAKAAEDDATNYVAPLIVRAMTTYEPFSYTYYITTGSLDEIREEFYRFHG